MTMLDKASVSVLVVERVSHTMLSWCTALVHKKLHTETMKLLIADLHWKNIGVTDQEALITCGRARLKSIFGNLSSL